MKVYKVKAKPKNDIFMFWGRPELVNKREFIEFQIQSIEDLFKAIKPEEFSELKITS